MTQYEHKIAVGDTHE